DGRTPDRKRLEGARRQGTRAPLEAIANGVRLVTEGSHEQACSERSLEPGAVRARARRVSQQGARAQACPAARGRPAHDLAVRGPPDGAVPGAGDAARRADLRA